MASFSSSAPEQTSSDRQLPIPARRWTRRTVLSRGAALGVAVPVSALWSACGGGSSAPTPAASQAGSASTAAAAGTTSAGASTATTAAAQAASGSGAATPAPSSTKQASATGQPGGILKHAVPRAPTTLDPHIDNGHTSTTLQGNIYDTLLTYDTEGKIVPSLADSFEATPDGKGYTFALRKGVKFHSGGAFTAADVVATWDRILNAKTNATVRPMMSKMDTYTAPDDATIKVTMKEPFATFVAVLASQRHSGIIEKKWTAAGNDYAKQMNGTGPFKMESYEANVRYVLVKNPDYWQPGMPFLDKIEETPIPDDTARVNAFKTGQANFLAYVPWQNFAEFESNPNYILYKGFDVFNLVRFNPKRPPLDNPLVRQALNYAIDRKGMIDIAFGGQGLPISVALIAPDSIWYNKELDGHWTYDPEKAKALFAQAGITDLSQVQLNFRSSTITVHFDTAQVITQQLQKLGLKVTLEPQDSPTLLQRRGTGDYQLMMDGLNLDWTDPDFYSSFFASDGQAHAAPVGYSNKEFDQLLDQGRTTLDFDKRKAIYKQAEEILLQDPPWMFLYWRPQAEATTKNIQGYVRLKGLGTLSEGFMERTWIKK